MLHPPSEPQTLPPCSCHIAQLVNHLPAMQDTQVRFLGREDPLKKKWQPTPVFLPEKSHGQRRLTGQSPWGHKELDMTEVTKHKYKPLLKIKNIRKLFTCIFFSIIYILEIYISMGFPGSSVVKDTSANARDVSSIPGSEDALEEEIATHSSILAWKISWTEKPGGLQSMRSQRIRHDLATKQQLQH